MTSARPSTTPISSFQPLMVYSTTDKDATKDKPNWRSTDEQARDILKQVDELHKAGAKHVGITYSANHNQTTGIIGHYSKSPDTPYGIGGSGQADVLATLTKLLKNEEFKQLAGVFRIIPITTMHESRGGTFDPAWVERDLGNVKNFLDAKDEGNVVLGWQNEFSTESRFAVGGGKGVIGQESKKADDTNTRRPNWMMQKTDEDTIQTRLNQFRTTYAPDRTPTATATTSPPAPAKSATPPPDPSTTSKSTDASASDDKKHAKDDAKDTTARTAMTTDGSPNPADDMTPPPAPSAPADPTSDATTATASTTSTVTADTSPPTATPEDEKTKKEAAEKLRAEEIKKTEETLTKDAKTFLDTGIQPLNRAAARFPDTKTQESYLAHKKLHYWDSKLAKAVDEAKTKMASEFKGKETEFDAVFTKLHHDMQLRHAELVTGKFDAKKSSEMFEEAKKSLTDLNKDAKTDELDNLRKTGLSEHIKEQSEVAKRQAFNAGSAATLANIHKAEGRLGTTIQLWKKRGAKDKGDSMGRVAAGEMLHYEQGKLETGIYKHPHSDLQLDITVDAKENTITAKIIANGFISALKLGEAIDMLMANNARKITLEFGGNPDIKTIEYFIKAMEGPPPRLAILALGDEALRELAKNDKGGKLQARIDTHNARVAANEDRLKSTADALVSKKDAAKIAAEENMDRVEKKTERLATLEEPFKNQPNTKLADQMKKDMGTLGEVEKALNEVERQQSFLAQEFKDAPPEKKADIVKRAEKVAELGKQLQTTLGKIEKRMERYRDTMKDATSEKEVSDSMKKVDELRGKASDLEKRATADISTDGKVDRRGDLYFDGMPATGFMPRYVAPAVVDVSKIATPGKS